MNNERPVRHSDPPDSSNEIPRLRPGIDITLAGLTLEEGVLVSRVDGRTSIQHLAVLVGRPLDETRRLVERLVAAGVLLLATPADRVEIHDDPFEGFVFPLEALSEPVDLDLEERKRILYTFGHLDVWSHYKLLGVRWRDDLPKIKRAYRERSKEWHPDRWRRPRLGSFENKIAKVFQAINEAYRVLSRPAEKASYDREQAPRFDEEDMAELLQAQRREARHAERVAADRKRRLASNPVHQRILRARKMYEEAIAHEKRGDLKEALNWAQHAHALDDREEYRALKRRLQVETSEQRIVPYLQAGRRAESLTRWDEAIGHFREAVRQAPEHGPARIRLAYNLLMGGRPFATANEHIAKALQICPQDPETHFVRGLCYEKAGMVKAAAGAYQRAIELKPNYTDAKRRLSRLRWRLW